MKQCDFFFWGWGGWVKTYFDSSYIFSEVKTTWLFHDPRPWRAEMLSQWLETVTHFSTMSNPKAAGHAARAVDRLLTPAVDLTSPVLFLSTSLSGFLSLDNVSVRGAAHGATGCSRAPWNWSNDRYDFWTHRYPVCPPSSSIYRSCCVCNWWFDELRQSSFDVVVCDAMVLMICLRRMSSTSKLL